MSALVAAIARKDSATVKAILRKKQVDVNQRDRDGKTPLILAVQLQEEEMVQDLLNIEKLNVNLQDFESGWTALHWSLYLGNLVMALEILKRNADVNVVDREGKSPMDLLMASFLSSEPLPCSVVTEDSDAESEDAHKSGLTSLENSRILLDTFSGPGASVSSLFTWGSNSNHALAHASPDDKSAPERVELDVKTPVNVKTFPQHQPEIKSVVMGKYHTIVNTSEGLFVAGFGGGRLGMGDMETIHQPKIIPFNKPVATVAAGSNHSVIVTTRGEVYTCGNNEHGTLGYSPDKNLKGPHVELSPREVSGIKRAWVNGAAASKYHTCIFTSNGEVWTWGTNLGQLGYQTEGSIQWTPRKVIAIPSAQISQIAATNSSTVLLMSTFDVMVLAANQVLKVAFPSSLPPKGLNFHYSRRSGVRGGDAKVIKLSCNDYQIAALTDQGDVFTWVPPAMDDNPTFAHDWRQSFCPQTRPKKVWSRHRKHLAAKDLALGLGGSLLIATDSGHAYLGQIRKEIQSKSSSSQESLPSEGKFYKYVKVPNLQHIEHVSASSSGAFGAIRVDQRSYRVDLGSGGGELQRDLKAAYQHTCSEVANQLGVLEDSSCDVEFVVGKETIYAHQVILAARAEWFRQLFDGNQVHLPEGMEINWQTRLPHSKCQIVMTGWLPQSLRSALEWIYSGDYTKQWDATILLRITSEKRKKKGVVEEKSGNDELKHYQEFHNLVRLFGLKPESRASNAEAHLLAKQVYKYRPRPDSNTFVDLVLRLSDVDVGCHQVVLRHRCPYFDTILRPGSMWTRINEQGLVEIELSQFRWEVVEVILKGLYSDMSTAAFDAVERGNLFEWINFLVEVLAAADELMLDRFKHVVCYLLNSVLEVRTVCSIFDISDTYNAPRLHDACVDFLVNNIETALEAHLLDDLPERLLLAVQAGLRVKQSAKLPHVTAMYEKIRQEAQQATLKRKLQTQESHAKAVIGSLEESSLAKSVESVEDYVTLDRLGRSVGSSWQERGMAFKKMEKRVEKPLEKPLERPPVRMPSSEDIFTMDMEEHWQEVGKGRRPSVSEKVPTTELASLRLGSWTEPKESKPKSFKEIMEEQSKVSTSPTQHTPTMKRKSSFPVKTMAPESPVSSQTPPKAPWSTSIPTSSPNGKSLREIQMEEVSRKVMSPTRAPSSPISSPVSISFSPKLSQKERRRQSSQTGKSFEATSVPKAWSSGSQTSPAGKSFKDIQQEEANRKAFLQVKPRSLLDIMAEEYADSEQW